MQRTAHSTHSLHSNLPDEYILHTPWRTDRLKDLPEKELRAWHSNMQAGLKPLDNTIILQYLLGEETLVFTVEPKRIYLPDGTIKYVTRREKQPTGHEDLQDGIPETIIRTIQSGLKKPGAYLLDTGKTQGDSVRELVESQMHLLETQGVERLGYFQEAFGRITHGPLRETENHILVNLNQCYIDSEGRRYPVIDSGVLLGGFNHKQSYCVYHTHLPGENNQYPSQPDIETALKQSQKTLIIATKDPDGESYTITEWRPKKQTDIQAEIAKRKTKKTTDPLGWLTPEEMKKLMDELFDKKQHTLKEENGLMTLKTKNTPN